MKMLEYIGGFGLVICLALVLAKFQGGTIIDPDDGDDQPTEQLIDYDGLAVAIVEETTARARLTPEQLAIFTDTGWRNYVRSKGGEFRVVDQHTDFTDPNDPFAEALLRPRSALPWLIVSNTFGGEEMPLPPTVDELMQVLRKWGEK